LPAKIAANGIRIFDILTNVLLFKIQKKGYLSTYFLSLMPKLTKIEMFSSTHYENCL